MSKTIAKFGYNTDLTSDGYTAWEKMGSKYNFNVEGEVLGVFSCDDKKYLLSQVTKSFGDNCMVGTVDAREVAFESEENSRYTLVSNNELSDECMTISRMLSGKDTREELNAGISIEQTNSFESLTKSNIKLEREFISFDEKLTVCGVEPEKFEKFKSVTMSRTR